MQAQASSQQVHRVWRRQHMPAQATSQQVHRVRRQRNMRAQAPALHMQGVQRRCCEPVHRTLLQRKRRAERGYGASCQAYPHGWPAIAHTARRCSRTPEQCPQSPVCSATSTANTRPVHAPSRPSVQHADARPAHSSISGSSRAERTANHLCAPIIRDCEVSSLCSPCNSASAS